MHHSSSDMPTAAQALQRLRAGNLAYLDGNRASGDVSPAARLRTAEHGQTPYAIIVGCSDSRAIPETIFSAGIGDLFVIRVAGNVIDNHQLGSIEYAAEHIGCRLIVVLGHTGCGAVGAAIHHESSCYIRFITDEIRAAIGEETNDYTACLLNVRRSAHIIENSLDIRREGDIAVVPAVYHLDTGVVDFPDGDLPG